MHLERCAHLGRQGCLTPPREQARESCDQRSRRDAGRQQRPPARRRPQAGGYAALQVGGRLLRVEGPHYLPECPLALEGVATGAAAREVGLDLDGSFDAELVVGVRLDTVTHRAAVHRTARFPGRAPTMPRSRACRTRAERSRARPRARRDITVPNGQPATSAISRYASPATSFRNTGTR